jgi:hypothetical protein
MKTNKIEKVRGVLLVIGGLILAATCVVTTYAFSPSGTMEVVNFVLLGVGCGMFGFGASGLLEHRFKLKHPESAAAKEIDAKDERSRLLEVKARAKGFNLMIYVFGLLLLVFTIMRVDYKAILMMVLAYLFVIGYSFCQRVRLEKEN